MPRNPADIDEEAAERFNEFKQEFVEEYGAARLYWLFSATMKRVNHDIKNGEAGNGGNDPGDFRIDDDLF